MRSAPAGSGAKSLGLVAVVLPWHMQELHVAHHLNASYPSCFANLCGLQLPRESALEFRQTAHADQPTMSSRAATNRRDTFLLHLPCDLVAHIASFLPPGEAQDPRQLRRPRTTFG